jgi:hypothetical protein
MRNRAPRLGPINEINIAEFESNPSRTSRISGPASASKVETEPGTERSDVKWMVLVKSGLGAVFTTLLSLNN